jgi:hypothetical protein
MRVEERWLSSMNNSETTSPQVNSKLLGGIMSEMAIFRQQPVDPAL